MNQRQQEEKQCRAGYQQFRNIGIEPGIHNSKNRYAGRSGMIVDEQLPPALILPNQLLRTGDQQGEQGQYQQPEKALQKHLPFTRIKYAEDQDNTSVYFNIDGKQYKQTANKIPAIFK